MSTQVSISTPWSHLAAVLASVATKDIRYYLNGFAVLDDPVTHQLVLCGADGYRATFARTKVDAPSDWTKGGLVFEPPEVLPKGKAAKGEVLLTVDPAAPRDSTIWWPGRSAPLPLVRIDDQYADIWKVRPSENREGEATTVIAFDPALIAPIQRALGVDGCRFDMDGDRSPIRVKWRKCPDVETVLMPRIW